ncbi:MAG: hypothetical protein HDT24_02015 [Ruminococcus sp.]|nr:hypothetical protein [Ruminococcus sp.]
MTAAMKFFGLAVITAASFLAGDHFSQQLKYRAANLKKMNYMVDDMMMMIRFGSLTVYEIAESLAESERFVGFDFLHGISRSDGVPFQRSWCNAVEKYPPRGLKAEDIRLLSDIGRKLGTSDAESQLRTLGLQQAELTSAISSAEAEHTKKAKLYRSMGALAGAFISIMLL